jgi:integrase
MRERGVTMGDETKRRRTRGSRGIWLEGNAWRVQHPVTKARHRFKRAEEARKFLRLALAELRLLGDSAFQPTTDQFIPGLRFGQAWILYDKNVNPLKTPRTAKGYVKAWKRIVDSGNRHKIFWPGIEVRRASTGLAVAYKNARVAEGAALSTIAQELSLLRAIANWASRDNRLCPALVLRWKVPPIQPRNVDPITRADYHSLLRVATPVQRALLVFFWCTGSRPQDIMAVAKSDLDLAKRVIRLPNLKTGTRTGVRARELPLTEEMIGALTDRDAWLGGIAATQKRTLDCTPSDAMRRLASPWLFPTKFGERLHMTAYRTALKSAFVRAGNIPLDLMRFRHAFATRWLAAGGDIFSLAKMMGTSVAMIEATYGHLSKDHLRAVVERMNAEEAPPRKNDDDIDGVKERPRVGYPSRDE